MGVPKLLAMDAAQAAGLREEEERLIDAFRVAGAVSPERAQSLAQLDISRTETFNRIETDRVLRLVGRNLYYLDEAAIVAKQDATTSGPASRRLVIVALLTVVVAVLVAYLVTSR